MAAAEMLRSVWPRRNSTASCPLSYGRIVTFWRLVSPFHVPHARTADPKKRATAALLVCVRLSPHPNAKIQAWAAGSPSYEMTASGHV
jgi:hypothetical protein